MSVSDPLHLFLPPVREWFRARLGEPTPIQRDGWPIIAEGRNALLLAPTGSGKTLAAFLACLDGLWRQPTLTPGVRVLYISPLKALNNDIFRNLQSPLDGVAEFAKAQGIALPRIEIAVRTGDTSTADRLKLARRPPQVLITTPESLHLLLTSKAREILRGVTHCIVDEIHALCPNKRGVFLSLLLERLREIVGHDFARIGLSATQRPLDEVARYLGGFTGSTDGSWQPRPVAIVDGGLRKNLDLQVVSPVEQFGPLPEKSIWPSIYRRLAQEILAHRSTIVFANNRRSVERLTSQLNECLAEMADASIDADALRVRAHHGSVALEVRHETEQALKDGRLRAVTATASLELGIDMGAVDLVCQVESPGNIARALQRVGRAGHLVGQSSKGRLLVKTLPDLLNSAVLAAEMVAGRVESLSVPHNCLDILAQQIIAMVAMDDWNIDALYAVLRRAYPYHDLSPIAFDSVLEMIAGRYRFGAGGDAAPPPKQLSALQPRISWDRVHHSLHALPGSQRLAIMHGGSIPDTGQYAVVTGKNVRLGEVDEEFVYERRIGDTFLLGTSAWRIERIDTDRVIVSSAEGRPAMVPFWRGESVGRSGDLGRAQGAFLRILGDRLDQPDCLDWLQTDYHCDAAAARNLRDFVARHLARTGGLPTDRTLQIEASRDPLGDWQVVLLCPFGRAINLTLRLAIEHRLCQRLGYRPQCLHHDDGVLIRLTESDEPVLDMFDGLTPDNVREMILDELDDSALFALRFRQNAARALMMPRGAAGKRAPLWLQRLRGRDLLQVARQHADFPIIAETFRECLHDHLDLPSVRTLLNEISSGAVTIQPLRLEMPSPFAASLLFAFTAAFMYQYDDVEANTSTGGAPLDSSLLDQLISQGDAPLPLDPRAVQAVDRRLRGVGFPPRSKAETAEWLRKLGDISASEIEPAIRGFLDELQREQVVVMITLNGTTEPQRWILAEDAERYRTSFADDPANAEETLGAAAHILHRFLTTRALVGLQDILRRYPFDPAWARQQLTQWTQQGRLVNVPSREAEPLQWAAPENFEQIQRGTLSLLRHEVMTCPPAQFADFVARWQYVHPTTNGQSADGVRSVLDRLQTLTLPHKMWEAVVLRSRVAGYQPAWLDEWIAGGQWLWHMRGDAGDLAFIARDTLTNLATPDLGDAALPGPASVVYDALRSRGAQFTQEIAEHLKLPIDFVRPALWMLVRLGLATNDRFDVARRGEPPHTDETPAMRSRGEVRAYLRDSRRRTETSWPEGRWSLVAWGRPDPEAVAIMQARLLLERFGIVARELALLADTTVPWRVLYEVLSRMELAGEVRRGYFVEGLSGAQFALPGAAKHLAELALPSQSQAPMLLLHSLDPANLYGSGAPFELAVGPDTPRTFLRRAGNWLVQKAGRPLLLIEQNGKRLTALASASADDLAQAIARLPDILKLTPDLDFRHKLTVETWNDQPITATMGKDLLERAGFVRDYQAMTLWAVWHAG